MEFRETLLAAQRNQQQKSYDSLYYKAKFDPPKKEQEKKPKDKLSANIQKFLAKKEEEEKQKKLEAIRKRDELLAMRDPKAMRKIQKSLKVFKSANKSVLEDAVDREHTALTREGPSQPDQDDYGYESQEAAAIYQKMMEKYSKIKEEPKFPTSSSKTKKDLNNTLERVKQALLHSDDPVPHKRRRKADHEDKEPSPPPKPEQEKKREEKPKFRKPAPPPMDFNQLLKIAEQKKADPLEVAQRKAASEPEPERLMTKKQKREYEEEMARRLRRQERIDAEKGAQRKGHREEILPEKEKRVEPSGFGRIPKLGDRNSNQNRNDSPKTSSTSMKEKLTYEKERLEKLQREKERLEKIQREKERLEKLQREKDKVRSEKEKLEREKDRIDREKLEKLKAEREKIERDIERLNRDKERLEKSKMKLESSVDRSKLGNKELKNNIDLKSQNTYRINKSTIDKKVAGPTKNNLNGHSSQSKQILKDASRRNEMIHETDKKFAEQSKVVKGRSENGKNLSAKNVPLAKPKIVNSFDFDKHVNSLKNGQTSGVKKPNSARPLQPGDDKRKMHPDDLKRKQAMKRRVVDSESEYDSEMDDFIDDGDTEEDYSKHIRDIFNYDKSKYRDIDDGDDPSMESSFSRQMHEEYVSKKIGIMEDLEDMRLEKQMNMKKKKKSRRISDD